MPHDTLIINNKVLKVLHSNTNTMMITAMMVIATILVAFIATTPTGINGFVVVIDVVGRSNKRALQLLHYQRQRHKKMYRNDIGSILPLHVRLHSSSTNDNDDDQLLLKEQYEEFQKILPMVKQLRESKELLDEYETKLASMEQTWYDRPDLQEEFLSRVEYEQQQRMIQLEQTIQNIYPDIYQNYIQKATTRTQPNESLLTVSPPTSPSDESNSSSDSNIFSLAIERPDLMIRMEQEYEIWNVMQSEIKELAPDLYEQVNEELLKDQQQRLQRVDVVEPGGSEDVPSLLSSLLMERKDLLQLVNTKINQLRQSVEDITEAVMKPKKGKNKNSKQKDATKKKKGFG